MTTDTPTAGHAPVAHPPAAGRPNGRGYFLDDDRPAVVVGPGADPQTLANAIASMVMLLGLAAPAAAAH